MLAAFLAKATFGKTLSTRKKASGWSSRKQQIPATGLCAAFLIFVQVLLELLISRLIVARGARRRVPKHLVKSTSSPSKLQ